MLKCYNKNAINLEKYILSFCESGVAVVKCCSPSQYCLNDSGLYLAFCLQYFKLMINFCVIPNSSLFIRSLVLIQRFLTCGTRTTGGTPRLFRWYASHFHYFYSKTWIHSFLLFYLSGFISNEQILRKPAILIVLQHCDLHARKTVSNNASQT